MSLLESTCAMMCKFFDVKPDVCDTCHAFGSFEIAQPAFTTGVLRYVYQGKHYTHNLTALSLSHQRLSTKHALLVGVTGIHPLCKAEYRCATTSSSGTSRVLRSRVVKMGAISTTLQRLASVRDEREL